VLAYTEQQSHCLGPREGIRNAPDGLPSLPTSVRARHVHAESLPARFPANTRLQDLQALSLPAWHFAFRGAACFRSHRRFFRGCRTAALGVSGVGVVSFRYDPLPPESAPITPCVRQSIGGNASRLGTASGKRVIRRTGSYSVQLFQNPLGETLRPLLDTYL
jgi:hypothetical protein